MSALDNKPVTSPDVVVASGGKITAKADDSWKPSKGNIITTAAVAVTTGAIKWFEIHTQTDIPAEIEIILTTAVVGVVNYFTPTSIKVILGGFLTR